MVILATAAVARAGVDVEAVAARAREAADATTLWFAVDTLEYLRRGGRIGAAQAWLGGALKIKPILTFDGEIVPIERVRTSGKAFERMVDYLRARHEDGADGWVIQHIQAPDEASAWWPPGARSSAASRCSCRRSDRSSAPTSARAWSASAASRRRCSTPSGRARGHPAALGGPNVGPPTSGGGKTDVRPAAGPRGGTPYRGRAPGRPTASVAARTAARAQASSSWPSTSAAR